jgi:8-oxo-dGTP pyrophosphatase MutT (NUDIX family)
VRETPAGWRFLMLRAFRHWDFPKGEVEAGENPKQAALREIREETTLDNLTFPWGNVFLETGPYNRGKVARYYLAQTDREGVAITPNPVTGRAEHAEIKWLSLTEATERAAPRVTDVLTWAAKTMGL